MNRTLSARSTDYPPNTSGYDTVIVPAREEGFQKVFLGQHRWYAIRISSSRKGCIRYIAAYRTAPICAVTHIAEVEEVRRYAGTEKYAVIFRSPAQPITFIPKGKYCRYNMQAPVYVCREQLLHARSLEELLGISVR